MKYFFNFEKLGYCKNNKKDGCILCKITEKDQSVESLIIYENENFIVSLNLYPYNPAHCLIFPKRHVVDIRALVPDEVYMLHSIETMMLSVLENQYNPAGFNIGFNMGLAAGASIEHLHLHIIPRYPNEIGIAELLAGKRVLVQDLKQTQKQLIAACDEYCNHNKQI